MTAATRLVHGACGRGNLQSNPHTMRLRCTDPACRDDAPAWSDLYPEAHERISTDHDGLVVVRTVR